MSQEIIESLDALGYEGECLDVNILEKALNDGFESKILRSLVVWIANELQSANFMDDSIYPENDLKEFLIELSRFLLELQCPYKFVTGPDEKYLATVNHRILLINFLLKKDMAARMTFIRALDNLAKHESPTHSLLRKINDQLNLSLPNDATTNVFFTKVFEKLNSTKNSIDFGKSLFLPSKSITNENWNKLEKLRQELDNEYDLRREMLLTRLDVTIQSFQWSDAIRKKDVIIERYRVNRNELNKLKRGDDKTDISELLAARDKLLYVEKTSSGTARENTKCVIQKHIIGSVPDRGGRTNELAPPPPEMPQWQKNRTTGPSGQRRGGHHQNTRPQQQRNQNNRQQNYQSNQNIYNHHQQQSSQSSQQQHYNNRGRGGGSRVQGGWNQGQDRDYGNQQYNRGPGNGNNSQSGGNSCRQNQNQNQNQDDGFSSRGRSHYNRGGRR